MYIYIYTYIYICIYVYIYIHKHPPTGGNQLPSDWQPRQPALQAAWGWWPLIGGFQDGKCIQIYIYIYIYLSIYSPPICPVQSFLYLILKNIDFNDKNHISLIELPDYYWIVLLNLKGFEQYFTFKK